MNARSLSLLTMISGCILARGGRVIFDVRTARLAGRLLTLACVKVVGAVLSSS
jgi:hypothetical protein